MALTDIIPEFHKYVERFEEGEKALKKLQELFDGVQRIVAPDGTVGLYIPFRLGVQTEWALHQNAGAGAGFSVSTAVDPVAAVIQHDGDQVQDQSKKIAGRRVGLRVHNTDFNVEGTNVGIEVVASNAPFGNIAIDAKAQFSPSAAVDKKLTIILTDEWRN